MNSLNPTVHSVNWEETTQMSYRLLWRLGADMFAEGRSYFDCKTTAERNGYLAACAACADAEMPSQFVGEAHRG